MKKEIWKRSSILLITAFIWGIAFVAQSVGMEYVPYDDMPALLHKGERVLTADEAKDYQEITSAVTNNETTNNWNITINSTEPLSPAETARQTRKAIQELNLVHGKA